MDTSQPGGAAYSHTAEWKFDSRLLLKFLRHRLLLFVVFGLFLFVVLYTGLLRQMPQVFTATVSVSMQGSSSVSSPLGALLGGASQTHSYLGVLRSQRMAKDVEDRIHLKDFLGLSSEEDAIAKIAGSLKVEDVAPDGLLYINITMSGPPRLGGDKAEVEKIRRATALVANAFPDALLHYMKESDTDKDLTLLRAAEKELKRVRQEYYQAGDRLADFVRHNGTGTENDTGPVTSASGRGGTKGGDPESVGSQLQALYSRKAQIEEEMAYATGLTESTKSRLKGDPSLLPDLPNSSGLNNARRDYTDASTTLDELETQYGEENPRVVAARKRLELARKRVMLAVKAIENGRTSDAARREAMQAEMDVVLRQIHDVERSFQSSKESGLEYDKIKRELEIRFEVLKQAVTQYATLSLQTTSAQNRITVVDLATPPRVAKPAPFMMMLVSAVGAIVLSLLCIFGEFFIRHRKIMFGVM